MGRTYKMRAYDRSRLELACAQVDPTGEGLRLEEFFQLAQARKTVPNVITYHAKWDAMRPRSRASRNPFGGQWHGGSIELMAQHHPLPTLTAPPPARATASHL